MPQETITEKIEFLRMMTAKLESMQKDGYDDSALNVKSIFDEKQINIDVGDRIKMEGDTQADMLTRRGFRERRGNIDSQALSSPQGANIEFREIGDGEHNRDLARELVSSGIIGIVSSDERLNRENSTNSGVQPTKSI